MAYLDYISDVELEDEVRHLLKVAEEAMSDGEKKFSKNVIDPFAAIFEIAGFKLDNYDTWHASELARQLQKTLQNAIGHFHQNILGNVNGWENPGIDGGIDIVNHEKRVIGEIKNKYNTLSGKGLTGLYHTLDGLVTPKRSIYKGYQAYYVIIIPKTPKRSNIPYTPSDADKGERCPENELIRKIDGYSFYSMVTDQDDALESLYKALPLALEKITGRKFNDQEKEKLLGHFYDAYKQK